MLNLGREQTWETIKQAWDIVIVGGGITGAGIFRYAAAAGLRVLLLDANDFAFGTSSRSSKLVHGGLRYLNQKQYDVTYESVRERERLLHQVPELVEPLCFLINNYVGAETSTKKYMLGLVIYDVMGCKWKHGKISRERVLSTFPQINPDGLKSGLFYYDAVVDDARLVLRLIEEGEQLGGTALNYARVIELMRHDNGEVAGVVVERSDRKGMNSIEIPARVVINASGPWTDSLRQMVDREPIIRKQRGSHLVIDGKRLRLSHAITFTHPEDNRTMFFVPWNGAIVVGTTDLDHPASYEAQAVEPFIDRQEFDYMMQAVHETFPSAGITEKDVLSTFSGLRPIIRTDSSSPSAQSRKHEVFDENGLLTITGGKLTTYRVMARAVLEQAIPRLGKNPNFRWNRSMFDPRFVSTGYTKSNGLLRRYGKSMQMWLEEQTEAKLEFLPGSHITPLEILYTARHEGVVHLDDLLLRRVRLGLLQHDGGVEHLFQLKDALLHTLNWSEGQWQAEVERYQKIIAISYGLPVVS